jgi:type IV pilus biogenesis protein CpaD/CtpE
MKATHYLACILMSGALLTGCTQTTPSMMNTSKAELVDETHMEQIPYDKLDDISMAILANQYSRYGDGQLELTMAYDPSSKNFTAMHARNKLKELEKMLAMKGVTSVKTSTLAMKGEAPSLMVMYPSVSAQAPSDCDHMPGVKDNKTGRFLGNYKFGCSVEMFTAQQVYRPSDLRGRGGEAMGVNEGRRITSVMETYHTLNDRQASGELEDILERDDLQAD